MLAVSNTTPLRYLLVIRQQDLLQKLLEKVLIPGAVFEELTDPHTRSVVRAVVSSHPEWIAVQDVAQLSPFQDLTCCIVERGRPFVWPNWFAPISCSSTSKRGGKKLCDGACRLLGRSAFWNVGMYWGTFVTFMALSGS
jgi:hypothetical protein